MARISLGLIAALGVVYLSLVLLLFATQRRLIYPAPRIPFTAAPGFREVRLETSDGLVLRALHKPAYGALPTILFFHGNGDSLAGAIKATGMLAAAGYGLMLPEYRGYGGNPGRPSEAGFYRDGEAALRWLGERGTGPDRIVLAGNSLGSGVAVEMAIRRPVAGLVLISGFSSLPDVAASHLPYLPARWLVLDRYENTAKLPRVASPVLVVHGAADTLIPAAHGVALARAARRGELEVLPGVGHELAYHPESATAMLRWLDRRVRRDTEVIRDDGEVGR